MTYLTDEVRLFEVVGESAEPNYGLRRGWLRSVLVRDCQSEAVRAMSESEESACRLVVESVERAA